VDKDTYNLLRYLAVAGNIVFVLWILYNGIEEGFQATAPLQILLYIGMLILLSVNAAVLSKGMYVRYVLIAGNVVFALWFVYSWIGKTQATGPEMMSLVGLTVLLALNVFLLYRKQN
jgi:hypothetical protein